MKQQLKKLAIVVFSALLLPFMACKKPATISENVSKPNTEGVMKTEAVSSWEFVFEDYFDNQSKFNNSWEKTSNRNDYNSNICYYDSSVPILANKDNKEVLVLTATKLGDYSYKSGHVKSIYKFKPGNNEEYRVVSYIKLIAKDGDNFKGFTQTYGAWPAFWTVRESGEWPKKGEIDIMEGYSRNGDWQGRPSKFASNLFYGIQTGENDLGTSCERTYKQSPVTEGWHKYEEYWKNINGSITVTTRLDDLDQATYTNDSSSPSNSGKLQLQNFGPHNIILNLCVGHTPKTGAGLFNNSQINLFSKTMMWIDQVTVEKRNIY